MTRMKKYDSKQNTDAGLDLRMGIDVGFSTVKRVVFDGTHIVNWEVADASSCPFRVARRLAGQYPGIKTMATGSGGHLLELDGISSVTEIKACAHGVQRLHDKVRAIIDIGGRNLKVVTLDSRGRLDRFEMNDRCAAGSGRFLEMIASKLDYTLEEFSKAADMGEDTITLDSSCAVFAESQIQELTGKNLPREDIARAAHRSLSKRISEMCGKVLRNADEVCLVGGGARDGTLGRMIEQRLGIKVFSPQNPMIVTALGASLLAQKVAPTKPASS